MHPPAPPLPTGLLVDCCGTEPGTPSGIMRTERGDWYFPDGTAVGFGGGTRFLVNMQRFK